MTVAPLRLGGNGYFCRQGVRVAGKAVSCHVAGRARRRVGGRGVGLEVFGWIRAFWTAWTGSGRSSGTGSAHGGRGSHWRGRLRGWCHRRDGGTNGGCVWGRIASPKRLAPPGCSGAWGAVLHAGRPAVRPGQCSAVVRVYNRSFATRCLASACSLSPAARTFSLPPGRRPLARPPRPCQSRP